MNQPGISGNPEFPFVVAINLIDVVRAETVCRIEFGNQVSIFPENEQAIPQGTDPEAAQRIPLQAENRNGSISFHETLLKGHLILFGAANPYLCTNPDPAVRILQKRVDIHQLWQR